MNLKDKTVVIDNKTYRYSKIVMLESNYPAINVHIHKESGGKLVLLHHTICDINPQHLYFLSSDKICEGDWFYDTRDRIVSNKSLSRTMFSIKIIASTDPSLNLSKPSDSFLQVYIDAYNKNEKIEECLVEYIDWCDYDDDNTWGGLDRADYRLKITKGEITIRKVKNSWSRDEVIELLKKSHSLEGISKIQNWSLNTWIEENL